VPLSPGARAGTPLSLEATVESFAVDLKRLRVFRATRDRCVDKRAREVLERAGIGREAARRRSRNCTRTLRPSLTGGRVELPDDPRRRRGSWA
jgi:hypothetical protein